MVDLSLFGSAQFRARLRWRCAWATRCCSPTTCCCWGCCRDESQLLQAQVQSYSLFCRACQTSSSLEPALCLGAGTRESSGLNPVSSYHCDLGGLLYTEGSPGVSTPYIPASLLAAATAATSAPVRSSSLRWPPENARTCARALHQAGLDSREHTEDRAGRQSMGALLLAHDCLHTMRASSSAACAARLASCHASHVHNEQGRESLPCSPWKAHAWP